MDEELKKPWVEKASSLKQAYDQKMVAFGGKPPTKRKSISTESKDEAKANGKKCVIVVYTFYINKFSWLIEFVFLIKTSLQRKRKRKKRRKRKIRTKTSLTGHCHPRLVTEQVSSLFMTNTEAIGVRIQCTRLFLRQRASFLHIRIIARDVRRVFSTAGCKKCG